MGKAANRKKTIRDYIEQRENIETRGFDLFFNHDRGDTKKMIAVIERMGKWAKDIEGLNLKGNMTISCDASNSEMHKDAVKFTIIFDEWTKINVIDAIARLDYIYRYDNANSDNWYSGCEFYTRLPS